MKLPDEDYRSLLWLSKQPALRWGGIYDRGGSGDSEVASLLALGLIEGVAKPYTAGRLTFSGGYRITPAGRAALTQEGER